MDSSASPQQVPSCEKHEPQEQVGKTNNSRSKSNSLSINQPMICNHDDSIVTKTITTKTTDGNLVENKTGIEKGRPHTSTCQHEIKTLDSTPDLTSQSKKQHPSELIKDNSFDKRSVRPPSDKHQKLDTMSGRDSVDIEQVNSKRDCLLANKKQTIEEDEKRHSEHNGSQLSDDQNGGPSIADLTGGFGYFQIFLASLVFFRYSSLALMTSAGPLLAPEVQFKCVVPDDMIDYVIKPINETMSQFLTSRCLIPLQNGTEYRCEHFWFNKTATGTTMTDSLELVCDRAYLKSTFQSAISVGVLLASILSGPISDQHGRLFVVRSSFVWSLFWGCVSYFANNFQLYTISRTFCTFGDTALIASLSLIMVELIPPALRGMLLIIVYTGWSLGVMFMPFICDYVMNYKLATLFTIIVQLVTCVPLLLVNESVRWSMVMGNFESAKLELERIHKWNGKCPDDFTEAFAAAKKIYIEMGASNGPISCDSESQLDKPNKLWTLFTGIWNSYRRIGEFFQSWKLAFTTLVIVWIGFNGELLYMLFILINSDVGDAKLINYIVGFGMEVLATLVGILMTSYMSRRMSVLTTMMFISVSCVLLSWTFQMQLFSIIVLNIAKLAISNLTSLSWVLVNESFPTTLRQTGAGICGALTSFGSVVAPFVRTEITKVFGFGTVMFSLGIITFLSSFVALMIKETKDAELTDNLKQMNDDTADANISYNTSHDRQSIIEIPSA